MALSLYDISNWATQTTYNVNDIYRYNNLYYYSKVRHNSGNTFNSDYSDGVIEYNGINKPYFFFRPSYSFNTIIKPNIKSIQFGDGFTQRSPNGLNMTLLSIDITFDRRTDAEARAILHFLTDKSGYKSFIFTPPSPYNMNKIFVCEDFNHTQIFSNNNTVQCKFTEVVI